MGGSGEQVGPATDAPPRFVLFHAAKSICSQKVRAVLAHHQMSYDSQPVNLFTGQTYFPEYVRLRMIGCASLGVGLVSRHHGSTSASAGCDGVVVPTLVDRQADAVIVDSRRICLLLDQLVSEERRLRATDRAAEIDAELAIVDELPNYQLLMGRQTGETASTPASRAAFSQRKVAWCDRYLAEHPDEPALVAAYTAKRAKELSAATDLFSDEAMAAALAKMHSALDELERKLARRTSDWLIGARPTMADLFWGIQILRLDDLGFGLAGDRARRPHLADYAQATSNLPALHSAVIAWPGART